MCDSWDEDFEDWSNLDDDEYFNFDDDSSQFNSDESFDQLDSDDYWSHKPAVKWMYLYANVVILSQHLLESYWITCSLLTAYFIYVYFYYFISDKFCFYYGGSNCLNFYAVLFFSEKP